MEEKWQFRQSVRSTEEGIIVNSRNYFEKVAGDWDRMREGFFSTEVMKKPTRLQDWSPGRQLLILEQVQGS